MFSTELKNNDKFSPAFEEENILLEIFIKLKEISIIWGDYVSTHPVMLLKSAA